MPKTRYLVAGLALVVLVIAVAGVAFAYGRGASTMGDDGTGSVTNEDSKSSMMGGMMGNQYGMGSMMQGGQGTSEGRMMGSFSWNEPFDLRFVDQMIMHHQGAIVSSRRMISDSEWPELRRLAENIQKGQSEQIEQMRQWRKQWYGDTERTFGMMDPTQMDEMMGEGQMEGMMGGSMRKTMGSDATDAMFFRMMIPHHQAAVDMSEQALDKAEHPELKELAQKIIDEQSAEIEQMRGYLEGIDSTNSS
jgi:uncharacterized protein (DUF305 family)